MATHSDNTNKTDGLPALTEAEDDDNEIPGLIPAIEHGTAPIVASPQGATASTAADLPTESGATLSQKAPTAHIPRTQQSAAMPSLIRAELPPPSLQPMRGFTQRRLSLTADKYAQSWIRSSIFCDHTILLNISTAACFGTAVRCQILEDTIKLPQAILDEATGALGTDAFVTAATGVEEFWLSQWDADASWGGGSTWDTPPAVDVGWGRSAPGFGGWGWSSF
ncbi:hypothetical protein B0H14DRAFT_3502534 [Mycena olivaceomarginata]|nr:hypothetical protein B0H14DRAFT_3502534 [Mycena olivaceomarginata]